jgi:hypothetical protein
MTFGEGEKDLVSDLEDAEKRAFLVRGARKILQRIDCTEILVFVVLFLLAIPAIALVTPTSRHPVEADGNHAIKIMAGSPPEFTTRPPNPFNGTWGTVFNFTAWIFDPENDIMTVTWEWGDGSPLEVSYTGDATPDGGYWLLQNDHVYNPYVPGRGNDQGTDYVSFLMNITLDDGNGNNVSCTTQVDVILIRNIGPTAASLVLPAGLVDPSSNVTLNTSSSDREGDELTWTYVFNNSVSDYLTIVNHTPRTAANQTVWNNITVSFANEGYYNVTVFVSDALPPYQTGFHNISQTYGPIHVLANKKPYVQDPFNVNPGLPIINATIGYVEVTFTIDASDPDGDALNLTWNFDDGTANVTNTSLGGTTATQTFEQVRNYTNGGSFNVSVTVTDGRPGHEVVVYQLVNVTSTNRPPSVVRFNFTYATLDYALVNETVKFTLVIFEPEKDPIQLVVDFGDNSTRLYMNLTEFVDHNVTVLFNHTFRNLGNYTVKIWYTDNKIGVFNHTKSSNVTVKVKTPVVVVKDTWSWWDYTSLGLFCMIPVLIALQYLFMARRRKAIESEGMSVEEWKLRKSQSREDGFEKELERQKQGGP